jgi:hypothetical protein
MLGSVNDAAPTDIEAARDQFPARTRFGAAFTYALLGSWAVVAAVVFGVGLASASTRHRASAVGVFAAVGVAMAIVQWWGVRHPASPTQSRRFLLAGIIPVLGISAIEHPSIPHASSVVVWAAVSALGAAGFVGFVTARRRLRRDPTVIANALAQGWSAERPYADYLGGFFRRPR